MANNLKRCLRATAHADDGSLEEAERRIQSDRLVIRKVGRGADRAGIKFITVPVEHRNYFQCTFQSALKPAFAVDHLRKLTYRDAVDDGNRMHSHKRPERCVKHRAVGKGVGIRTIQYDQLLVALSACLHDIMQRADVGIETRADILDVKDQDVCVVQLFLLRFPVVAIQRHYRQPQLAVYTVLHMLTGVGSTPKSMLGRENLYKVHTQSLQGVGQMGFTHHRSVVHYQRNALAAEQGEVFVKLLGANDQGSFRIGLPGRRGVLSLGTLKGKQKKTQRPKYSHCSKGYGDVPAGGGTDNNWRFSFQVLLCTIIVAGNIIIN